MAVCGLGQWVSGEVVESHSVPLGALRGVHPALPTKYLVVRSQPVKQEVFPHSAFLVRHL